MDNKLNQFNSNDHYIDSNMLFVNKKYIIKKIIESKIGIWMLGTTAFGLEWHKDPEWEYDSSKKLDNVLLDKYIGGKYSICVIAESDPILESFSLVSKLNNKKGSPIAQLMETRTNATIKLRNFFKEQYLKKYSHKNSNIEPTSDVCRKTLDQLYEEKFITNICKELAARGVNQGDLVGELIENVRFMCIEKANYIFNNSSIVDCFIDEKNYVGLSKSNKKYTQTIDDVLNNRLKTVDTIDDLINASRENLSAIYEEQYQSKTLKCEYKISSEEIRKYILESVLDYLSIKEKRDFKLIKEYASKEAYNDRKEQLMRFENDEAYAQRLVIKNIFHPIPLPIIKIDNEYYGCFDIMNVVNAQKFIFIGKDDEEYYDYKHPMFSEFKEYFDAYMNSPYCAEETSKGNRKEVIYNYNSEHTVIGQMPRDSFYGSSNYKLVMWALVFNRDGDILLHKRSVNAKDNQGMWDKSVGGHISPNDYDTKSGASREIAEELYTVEEAEQGHSKASSWTNINKDKIIYLGKWNESRYPNFATSLRLESDEFYSFSFESPLTEKPINSMRVLPDGTRIEAKCFVDLYFVVVSKDFDLQELKNSKYIVLSPQRIKEYAKKGYLPKDASDKEYGAFEVTPDLAFLIDSPEWDNEITKFSLRVKDAFSNMG